MSDATTKMRGAIVTVTYNSSAEIDGFLSSALTASDQPTDVVVVDNASIDADDTRAIAEKYGAHFIGLSTNDGYGSGMNIGVRAALEANEIGHVLISNPDVVLSPGSLDRLAEILERDAGVGAVGPRILTESGETYPSARELPSLSSGVGHALLGKVWPQNPWTRAYHNSQTQFRQTGDVGWLSGACLVLRARAFTELGGFDERFFMYFEDVDLGRRLREAGWQNRYLSSVEVVHMGARSTSQAASAMLAAHHASAYRYLSGRYPRPIQAPLRWALKLGLWIRLKVSLLT
jgi:N-acetylglucosaminyl-diphospho-decaprenol L-rhamnosyltransferase